MKKNLSFMLSGFAILAHSQCNIIGQNTIHVNAKKSFKVEKENAQCDDCYQWTVKGKDNLIESDNRKSLVDIIAKKEENFTLNLRVFTSSGIEQCSRYVKVETVPTAVDNAASTLADSDCEISSMNYTEVKYGEGKVVLIPEQDNPNFSYRWSTIYKDGNKANSKDKIAQFNYNSSNPIDKINLIMSTSKCTKLSVRTYKEEFWQ